MVTLSKSSQSNSFQTKGISCYSLSITLNAFSFHLTKAKAIKREYRLYMNQPLLSYFLPLFSVFTFLHSHQPSCQECFLTQGLSSLNFLYLEGFSPNVLYLCSFTSFRFLLSVRSFPTVYTVVIALPTLHTSIMTYMR